MELNINIEDIDAITSGQRSVLLQVESEMSWEVWPIGYEFAPEVCQVLIRASEEEEGQIVFVEVSGEPGSLEETRVLNPILPVFFLVNGEMQIRCDNDMEVKTIALDQNKQITEGFVKSRSKNFMSSMSEPRMIDFPSGRLLLRISVNQPSQLCLDLLEGDEQDAHASICIAHEENEKHAWANVYRDIMCKGMWVPDKRTKMGFFNYEKNEPYELMVLVREGSVFLTFSSDDGPVAMREYGKLENNKVDRVRIRETPSASGMPGIYDVEEVS